MEIIDLFTVVVLVGMTGEAYARMRFNRKAGNILEQAQSQGRVGEVPKNIDVELMSMHLPPIEWRPGLGAYLSVRPMLLFFALIVVLAGALYTVGLIATVPKMILAAVAFVLGVTFHSGPDRYTLFEYFIQTNAQTEAKSLGNRELGILYQAERHMEKWALLQVVFALGLLPGILLPMDFAAVYVMGLILVMFLVLGYIYQIQKGIFAGPT